MAGAAADLVIIDAAQATFATLNVLLHLTAWRFPPDAKIQGNDMTVDYVVIGGGTAGSIVASRLTEDPNCTVAVIEAGDDPPLDSDLPGLFTLLPRSSVDYNFKAKNDYYTSQNVQGNAPGMTSGKLLGGTSSISHTLFLRGNAHDYEAWVKAAGNDSWSYQNLLKYFIKSENVNDKEIKNSDTADLHGFDGNLGVLRQKNPVNDDYIKSLEEIGYDYNPDVNGKTNMGVGYAYHLIANGLRQDGATSYLSPAKNRKNLLVFKKTTVIKILFDDSNNAIGVEAVTSDLKTIKIYARKEVLVAAGIVKSAQLLMLSGIGPKDHLKNFGIPVRSDLPVGKNLRDRVGLLLAFQMQPSDEKTPPMNPHIFPVPATIGYKALNESQTYPDYQAINFIITNENPGLLMICTNVIKYDNIICNKLMDKNKGHVLLLAAMSNSHPKSTGELLLRNTNPLSTPSINIGLFNKDSDLEKMAAYLLDYSKILNTTYFKSVNATFVDLGLWKCRNKPKDSLDYWKCYALEMSSTFWQYCGTCAMGPVTDGELKVRGMQRLRVVDASAIPSLNSGEILAAVVAFAEKAADLIKKDMPNLKDQIDK